VAQDPAAWVAGLSDDELMKVTRTYRRLYDPSVLDAADREAEARGLDLLAPDPEDEFEDVPIELRPALQVLGFAGFVGLVGGQFGYSMRPGFGSVVGQLPWRTVLMRAGDLHDPDPLIVLLARVSFNYMLLGTLVGALAGALGACLLLLSRRRVADSAAAAAASAAASQDSPDAPEAAGAGPAAHVFRPADPLTARLVRLAELRGSGLITEEEYRARKAELLRLA
jgi:hypothetical protein